MRFAVSVDNPGLFPGWFSDVIGVGTGYVRRFQGLEGECDPEEGVGFVAVRVLGDAGTHLVVLGHAVCRLYAGVHEEPLLDTSAREKGRGAQADIRVERGSVRFEFPRGTARGQHDLGAIRAELRAITESIDERVRSMPRNDPALKTTRPFFASSTITEIPEAISGAAITTTRDGAVGVRTFLWTALSLSAANEGYNMAEAMKLFTSSGEKRIIGAEICAGACEVIPVLVPYEPDRAPPGHPETQNLFADLHLSSMVCGAGDCDDSALLSYGIGLRLSEIGGDGIVGAASALFSEYVPMNALVAARGGRMGAGGALTSHKVCLFFSKRWIADHIENPGVLPATWRSLPAMPNLLGEGTGWTTPFASDPEDWFASGAVMKQQFGLEEAAFSGARWGAARARAISPLSAGGKEVDHFKRWAVTGGFKAGARGLYVCFKSGGALGCRMTDLYAPTSNVSVEVLHVADNPVHNAMFPAIEIPTLRNPIAFPPVPYKHLSTRRSKPLAVVMRQSASGEIVALGAGKGDVRVERRILE